MGRGYRNTDRELIGRKEDRDRLGVGWAEYSETELVLGRARELQKFREADRATGR